MKKELPQRKRLRLKHFDYNSNGAYFITICTQGRKTLFSPVGADSISARMLKKSFEEIIGKYKAVSAPIYVVMPNHFHAIITISREDMESSPTVSQIVQEFKRYSTIEYIKLVKSGLASPFDRQVWQRSFFDHVIRNQNDYDEIYKYIYENPLSWQYDKLYCEDNN